MAEVTMPLTMKWRLTLRISEDHPEGVTSVSLGHFIHTLSPWFDSEVLVGMTDVYDGIIIDNGWDSLSAEQEAAIEKVLR